MRLFVTGASGFVGGAVARSFAADHDVRAMARSEEAAARVAETGAVVCKSSLESVTAADVGNADVVVHAAALVAGWAPAAAFHLAIVDGTKNMLTAAQAAGASRFVHISSDSALFGGRHMRDVDETTPVPDASPYPYARAKAAAERMVVAANDPSGGFETVVLRPVLVWGPGDGTTLPEVVEAATAGSWVWVGHTTVDTTHIDNLVEGVRLAIERGRGGEIYYITDEERHLLRDFMTAYAATAGATLPGRGVPRPVARSAAWCIEQLWAVTRPGVEPPVSRFAVATFGSDSWVRSTKAADELGYRPVVDVATGLRRLQADTEDGEGTP